MTCRHKVCGEVGHTKGISMNNIVLSSAKEEEYKSDNGFIQIRKRGKLRKLNQEQIDHKRRKLWVALVKKDIPKVRIIYLWPLHSQYMYNLIGIFYQYILQAHKQQVQTQRANMMLLRKVSLKHIV